MAERAPAETWSDAHLVRLSGAGDRQAFDRLAGRWGSQLYRFLVRFVGDPEEARDVCQEALLKAYVNIGRLRTPEHFRAWLHQIAVNLCRDRGRVRRPTLVPIDEGDQAPAAELPSALPSPLSRARQADLRERLSRLLAHLSEEQRTAILLAELQGFTSAEISRITGVPAATVRSRVFHGLRALRRLAEAQGLDHRLLSDPEDQP